MRKANMSTAKKWLKSIIGALIIVFGITVFAVSTKADEVTVSGSDTEYTDGTELAVVKEFKSPGGNIAVKIMKEAFETPWRVAIIGEDLNVIADSDIVTSVCEPAADMDYSFIKPGKLAWSWWSSTGDDPIAFEPQYEYIDFAAENGFGMVLIT